MNVSGTFMSPLNPIRLRMDLSWSVWYCDILSRPDNAVRMMREAFDDTLERMDDS